MSKFYTVQTDFSKGQISDQLLGRSDTEDYSKGASLLQNVIPRKAGGITKRPGTRYFGEVQGKAKLFTFETSRGESFIISLAFWEWTSNPTTWVKSWDSRP